MSITLYHYTCEHSHERLGREGVLKSAAQLSPEAAAFPPAQYVWLTDLAVPARGPLGLTSYVILCDRTEHRYRVTDHSSVMWWMHLRPTFPAIWRDELESLPGARPVHWWVSQEPVPVVYDPIHARSAAH